MASRAYRATIRNRPEMKVSRTAWASAAVLPFAQNWSPVMLFNIAQGVLQLNRIGNKVLAKLLKIKFHMLLEDESVTLEQNRKAWYRIMIIQWYDHQANKATDPTGPTNVQVFDSTADATPTSGNLTNILANYRPKSVAISGAQRNRSFRVLYDKAQQLFNFPGAAKPEEVFEVTINPRSTLRWATDGSGLTNMENPIALFAFASETGLVAAEDPTIRMNYQYSYWFTDP